MLILVRGLPNSGKTTFVKMTLKGMLHLEADMFFSKDGQYCFDGNKLKVAHNLCQTFAKIALEHGADVVVSNTFTTLKEMEPYLEEAKNKNITVKVYRMTERIKGSVNEHNVPVEVIEKMEARFEDYYDEIKLRALIIKDALPVPPLFEIL